MSETTIKGQVRQHYEIKTTTEGAGLTEQHHLEGVTSEAWTGTEWVDVRALVALKDEVLALADELAEPVFRAAVLLPDRDMGRHEGEDVQRHRDADAIRAAVATALGHG